MVRSPMLLTCMTAHTSYQNGCGSPSDRRTPVVVCVAALSACALSCSLLGGCGQSVRDDHARVQSAVIEAKPGDGRMIASAIWTGENIASEDGQSRVASVDDPQADSAQ